MSDVTVKQLAEVLAISTEKLMQQLKSAGIKVTSDTDTISNEAKVKLLQFLRDAHGKEKKSLSTGKKVVLKRKSKGVLRVTSGTGLKNKTKNINIEVKKKKITNRPSQAELDELERDRREAQEALAQRKQQLKQEEQEKKELRKRAEEAEAEEVRLAEQEAARLRAEEAAQAAAEAAEVEADEAVEDGAEAEDSNTDAEVESSEDTDDEAADSEAEETDADADDGDAEAKPLSKAQKDEAEKKRKHEALVEEQVRKAIEERSRRKREQSGKDEGPRGGGQEDWSERKHDKKSKTRYGRKQLHVHGNKSDEKQLRPRLKSRSDKHGFQMPTAPVVKTVQVPESITVGDLAKEMAVKSGDVIKALMNMGMMVTINQSLDQDTAMLVVEELGHKAEEASIQTIEEELKQDVVEAHDDKDAEPRPPVVTVMGHVDHGKTSLLDFIRKSKVTDQEAGGITQHIGAYHAKTSKGGISFIDTPGHAAFTAMRARGAQVTDIVILVVAANDGVMPQTREGIDHARAAGVPLIVAVNKMDLPEANIDKVKQELAKLEVVPEDWGGEVQFVPVSAKTGEGVEDLLEAVLLQSEVLELKAVKKIPANGVIIESSLDKGRGPVATVLVKNGTLKKGDMILCGEQFGRARSLINESGKDIKSVGPSMPAVVIGLSGVPVAGDEFIVVANKRKAREAANQNREKERDARLSKQQAAKLENLMSQMGQEDKLEVNLLIKADVQGSVEALRDSLVKLSNDDVNVNVISSGVGGITNTDAQLASASNAIIIGFNVRADKAAREIIKESDLDLHYFSIIYEAIDQVKAAITGILGTEIREEIIGLAEVRDVFTSSQFGTIAGCIVSEGVVRRDNPIRVLRDNVVIFEGELESLRRHKDDVKEVRSGTECGIGVKQYNDVKPGDQIECYERVEVQKTLD